MHIKKYALFPIFQLYHGDQFYAFFSQGGGLVLKVIILNLNEYYTFTMKWSTFLSSWPWGTFLSSSQWGIVLCPIADHEVHFYV